MKQTIRIKFVDFYKEFNYKTNIIYNIILKHYNVEIVDNPDYLIYSVFGTEHYNYDCIKIFYSGENLDQLYINKKARVCQANTLQFTKRIEKKLQSMYTIN